MVRPPGERGGPARTAPPQAAADQSHSNLTSGGEIDVESLLPPLVQQDALVYGAAWLAAQRGVPAPSNEELLELSGHSSYSTPHKVLRRLERLGLLVSRGFQRGRQLTILASGKSTAAPRCRSPHWRHRADLQPARLLADNDMGGDAA